MGSYFSCFEEFNLQIGKIIGCNGIIDLMDQCNEMVYLILGSNMMSGLFVCNVITYLANKILVIEYVHTDQTLLMQGTYIFALRYTQKFQSNNSQEGYSESIRVLDLCNYIGKLQEYQASVKAL